MAPMARPRKVLPEAMSERRLQEAVVAMGRLHGWLAYHTHDSRHSARGFPDLVLIRGDRLLAIELKSDKGRVTVDQAKWLQAFAGVNRVDAMIMRPAPSLDEIEWLLR